MNPSRLRTLIADDEALARALLTTLIQRDPELELIGEAADGRRAFDTITRTRPDLVLLDVQMPAMSGIEVLQRLTALGVEIPYTVFVTAHDQHAIEAFELNALDYLVKPVEKARFGRSIARAKQAVRQREMLDFAERFVELGRTLGDASAPPRSPELVVRQGGEVISFEAADIVWVEAANQYSNIHTVRGTFVVAESLAAYQRKLSGPEFVRIHRSALINARRARRVLRKGGGTHDVIMEDGARLPLARSRRWLVPTLLRQARESEA